MTRRPDAERMGWEADSLRSRIDNRVCPRRQCSSDQTPSPSGPRFFRPFLARSANAPRRSGSALALSSPKIPHISALHHPPQAKRLLRLHDDLVPAPEHAFEREPFADLLRAGPEPGPEVCVAQETGESLRERAHVLLRHEEAVDV